MTTLTFDVTDTPERGGRDAPAVAPELYWAFGFEGRTGAAPHDCGWPPLGFRGLTSDFARNRVGREAYSQLLIWVVRSDPPGTPSLAELMADLRDRLDLPVEDIASMVGVRRRQFYNLINGATVSSAREARMRLLHAIVSELEVAVGGDRARLRAAILMPVGERFETFYSAAAEGGDLDKLRIVGRELVRRINAGEVAGMIDRPAPHLQRLVQPGAAERVRDHLRGHDAPPDDLRPCDDEDAGDV